MPLMKSASASTLGGFPTGLGMGGYGSMGPGMVPSSLGPGMVPSSMGPGMPPSSMGPGMPPSSMGPGMPQSSMGPGMPPSSMGPGMSLSSMGPGMPPSSMGPGMTSSSMAPPGLPPNTMASNQYNEQVSSQAFMTQYPGMTALGSQALSHSLGGQALSHSLGGQAMSHSLGGQGLSQYASQPFTNMSQAGMAGLERLSQMGQGQQFQAGTEGSQPNSGPPTPAPSGKSSAAIRQDQLVKKLVSNIPGSSEGEVKRYIQILREQHGKLSGWPTSRIIAEISELMKENI